MSDSAHAMPMANSMVYDVLRYRNEFPILSEQVHGKPLIFLDNAASAQKPQQVIDAVR